MTCWKQGQSQDAGTLAKRNWGELLDNLLLTVQKAQSVLTFYLYFECIYTKNKGEHDDNGRN